MMSKVGVVGILEPTRIVTGHVDDALRVLRRVVGAYGRDGRWSRIKIGYSSNYKQRWFDYKRNGWHALVPIYRTSGLRNAHRMEEELILHSFENSVATFMSENIAAGRNGNVCINSEVYHVYLALARSYARLVK